LNRFGNSDYVEGLLLIGQQSPHALISERASLQGIPEIANSKAIPQQHRSYLVNNDYVKSSGASGVPESGDLTSSRPDIHSALPVPNWFLPNAREIGATLTNDPWFDSAASRSDPLPTSNQDRLPQRPHQISQADTVSSLVHPPSFISVPLTPVSTNSHMWTRHTVRHQSSTSSGGRYTNPGNDSTVTWPVASHDTL
jgi:hypothetical protein